MHAAFMGAIGDDAEVFQLIKRLIDLADELLASRALARAFTPKGTIRSTTLVGAVENGRGSDAAGFPTAEVPHGPYNVGAA